MSICDECHAGCCRSLFLAITIFDVLKIKDALKLEYDDICEFVPTKYTEKEAEQSAQCLIKLTDVKRYQYHQLQLRKKTSSQINLMLKL